MHFTVFLILALLPAISYAFDPITVWAIGGLASSFAGSVSYIFYEKYYSCSKVECCIEPWVNESPNIDFRELYGQPLVVQLLSDILKRRQLSPKPISISFHGPTGTGKTFLSMLLSKKIFKKAMESDYVRIFSVAFDFPNPSKGFEYQERVRKTMLLQLSKCKHSIFIFDEFENVPPPVVTAITPFLEQRGIIPGVDTKYATFIFISNMGQKAIIAKTYEMWKNGVSRSDFKLQDFEKTIKLAVTNEEGAYKNSALVTKELIDAYVPFLPLEKHHVKSCIIDEFWKVNKRQPTSAEVMEILQDITFSPDLNDLYAEVGCKHVAALVLRQSFVDE